MQILGLLGMYFDAVVVEVKTFFIFIQIGSGHTVYVSDIDVRVKEQPSCEEMPTMILKNGPTGIYGKITKAEQCPAKLWP